MGLEMPRGLYTQERTTHKHKHAHCTTQRMMDCTPVGSSCRSFGKAPRKSRYSEKLFCCWLLAFGFWLLERVPPKLCDSEPVAHSPVEFDNYKLKRPGGLAYNCRQSSR
ncbi:unnamed protein product [Fusarium graminearum]|nr:unnamed protein product [Fusarium graminearum]